MAPEPEDWEKITPKRLVPAVKHIRESSKTAAWKCSVLTQKLCYAALHPGTQSVSLGPGDTAFLTRKVTFGIQQQFNRLLKIGTPPAVFKAFFDAYRNGLEIDARTQFDQTLRVGLANASALRMHPVEWAKSHIGSLNHENGVTVRRWIKEVCDGQDCTKVDSSEDFEKLVFWTDWKAPKLIHMQPSGNTPYAPAFAWVKEDETLTRKLLETLSARFVEFIMSGLKEVAGAADVRLAQSKDLIYAPFSRGGRLNADCTEQQPRRGLTGTGPATTGPATWDAVEISFLSDERVQICNGPVIETRNYAEFGFSDRRSKTPTQAWVTLRTLAEEGGVIRNAAKTGKTWPKIEKRIQEIRRVLREHFNIASDPIPFIEGTGYRASFKIRCNPSFHT